MEWARLRDKASDTHLSTSEMGAVTETGANWRVLALSNHYSASCWFERMQAWCVRGCQFLKEVGNPACDPLTTLNVDIKYFKNRQKKVGRINKNIFKTLKM